MKVGDIARFTRENDRWDNVRVRILAVNADRYNVEILSGDLKGTVENGWRNVYFREISPLEYLAEEAE